MSTAPIHNAWKKIAVYVPINNLTCSWLFQEAQENLEFTMRAAENAMEESCDSEGEEKDKEEKKSVKEKGARRQFTNEEKEEFPRSEKSMRRRFV